MTGTWESFTDSHDLRSLQFCRFIQQLVEEMMMNIIMMMAMMMIVMMMMMMIVVIIIMMSSSLKKQCWDFFGENKWNLSTHLFIQLSINQLIHLSMHVSIHPCIDLFIHHLTHHLLLLLTFAASMNCSWHQVGHTYHAPLWSLDEGKALDDAEPSCDYRIGVMSAINGEKCDN